MFRMVFIFLAASLFCSSTFAQKEAVDDGPVGIFESRAAYYEFMGNAKKAAYGPNGSPELKAMIPMLNDIALNKPIGSTAGQYKTQASTVGLLADKKIRSEIEMVDHQYEELKQMNEQIQKRVADEIRGIDFSKSETITTRIKGIRDRAQKDLDSVLLPHQVKRLRQLHLQTQLQRRSLVEVITSQPLKEDLEITDAQTKMLQREEKKMEAELAKKIAELRDEARKKLISKLKPEQEKQINDLVGDSFDFGHQVDNAKNRQAGGKKNFKK